MIIHSWNVNGIRACTKKGFLDYLEQYQPDIVGLQEVKALPEQLEQPFPEEYHAYWNPAKRRGYSGTVILSKVEPIAVTNGIGIEEHDDEGRVMTAEYDDFYFVTVYTPNAKGDLSRLPYRTEAWDPAFLNYLQELKKKKTVVFGGDLNVAHEEIDLARPKSNRGSSGFTDEERANFSKIVKAGFIDTFRDMYPDEDEQYSWWSYRAGARDRNVGWRIDYMCVDQESMDRVEESFVLDQVLGSDHCPVGIEFVD